MTPCDHHEPNGCSNEGRYATAKGEHLCSLHAMVCGVPHVRASDLPTVLAKLETLLDTLDAQLVTAGYTTRSELRQLIASRPVLKQEVP